MGRITAYASQPEQTNFHIKKLGFNIVKVDPPIKSKPYFLTFGHQFVKNNPHLSQTIWNNIAKVRDKVTKNVIGKYID